MSYRHTLEAALESLRDLEELILRFPGDGEIPSIDLDLGLQKLRNIYEILLLLKTQEQQNQPSAAPAAAAASPAVTPEPQHKPPATAASPTVTPDPSPKAAVSTTPTPVSETATAPAPAAASSAQILSDRFKGRPTLHETFHPPAGTFAQSRPIENLASAIGINDRFTFMRELFKNDAQLYDHTIRELNDASNFNEAYNYMIQHFEWNMDSDAVQLLLEIIRRKFIIGRHE